MGELNLIGILLLVIPTFLSIIAHEVAHGYVAYKLGDDTAKRAGRLSLNPIRHIDPFGTIALPLILLWSGSGFLFGWAKPVPVNFGALKNPKRDLVLVSSAGIVVNLIIAFFAFVILQFANYLNFFVVIFLLNTLMINMVLILFNILPVPPLDGSKMFFGWIDEEWAQRYVNSGRIGLAILIVVAVVFPLFGASFGIDLDILRWYISSGLNFVNSLVMG